MISPLLKIKGIISKKKQPKSKHFPKTTYFVHTFWGHLKSIILFNLSWLQIFVVGKTPITFLPKMKWFPKFYKKTPIFLDFLMIFSKFFLFFGFLGFIPSKSLYSQYTNISGIFTITLYWAILDLILLYIHFTLLYNQNDWISLKVCHKKCFWVE